MFLFCRVLPYATNQRNFGKQVYSKFQEFPKKYTKQFLQFLHAKTVTSSPEQFFLKIVFWPFSYSEKMRWRWGWSKQLYALFIVKTLNFTERDFSKNLTFQRNYHKDFKITSFSQYWWLYCNICKCFCLLRIILLENTMRNNF